MPSSGLVYSQIDSSLFSFIFPKTLKPPLSGDVMACDVVEQWNILKNIIPAFHLSPFAQQSRCVEAYFEDPYAKFLPEDINCYTQWLSSDEEIQWLPEEF